MQIFVHFFLKNVNYCHENRKIARCERFFINGAAYKPLTRVALYPSPAGMPRVVEEVKSIGLTEPALTAARLRATMDTPACQEDRQMTGTHLPPGTSIQSLMNLRNRYFVFLAHIFFPFFTEPFPRHSRSISEPLRSQYDSNIARCNLVRALI